MSRIGKAVEEYLALRRSLGFKLRGPGHLLRSFVRFLDAQGVRHITINHALEWARTTEGVHPARSATKMTAVRVFARHLSSIDPKTEIPPQRLLPHAYPRRSPHIFPDSEIRMLIDALQHLRVAGRLGRWTYSACLGLMASTGIRSGEARALDRADVDLDEGLLTLRDGKFGKSRLVPIHGTTREALRRYVAQRDSLPQSRKTPAFFVLNQGTPISKSALHWVFRKLLRLAGLDAVRPRPLLSDFRHTFAVRTVIRWYRAGLDVQRQMPVLSTYLGHVHIADTYWYLSAVPELLGLAGSRLESTLGDLP